MLEVAFMLEDVTERKLLEDELTHRAFHDPLTGLPNRDLFMNRLTHAVSRIGRREKKVAVLFMDLDNFKYVNDSLGHKEGDRLLVVVTERLTTCLRPGDTLARLGGDEFTVLLENIAEEGEAINIAERISQALQNPVILNGHEVYATTSIGIVLAASGGDRAEALLQDADAAMYQAKRKGKSRYEIFHPEMKQRSSKRLRLEGDLRRALEREEFLVLYQPVVLVESGQMVGIEASARWEHPERGLLPPSEFVQFAEETGLIISLGRWVLREACKQAAKWHELYPADPLLTMGVNLSARQFQHPKLVEDVAGILEETGLKQPDPGDYRKRSDRGRAFCHRHSYEVEGSRGTLRHRRLRHRLLFAVLPQAIPGGLPQDRPIHYRRGRERP
jgi:diguanylate cyclase (GGDEF)-like protein